MSTQLELLNSVSDTPDPSLTNSVSERKYAAIQRFLNSAPTGPIACVNTYSPSRRKAKYFRLSYRSGGKIKHLHVPGGNVMANLAKYRAQKLEEMIDRGAELTELLSAVKDYRGN